jgi:hypothetical protein
MKKSTFLLLLEVKKSTFLPLLEVSLPTSFVAPSYRAEI